MIIIIASIKDQRRRAGYRGLAGPRKGIMAFFFSQEARDLRESQGLGRGLPRAPVSLCLHSTLPPAPALRRCQPGSGQAEDICPRGVGASPYVPCSGVHLRSLTKPRNPLPSQRRFVGDRPGAAGLLSTLGSGGKTRLHILF